VQLTLQKLYAMAASPLLKCDNVVIRWDSTLAFRLRACQLKIWHCRFPPIAAIRRVFVRNGRASSGKQSTDFTFKLTTILPTS
jgi:hypothetical protein